MRAPSILLLLFAAAANAQPSQKAPPEELLTPPPITSAPRDDEPLPVRVPEPAANPEDEFLPLPGTSASPAEPPPPPRATSTPRIAPPSTPPPPRAATAAPAQPAPPRAVGPAEPARSRALRYSRYSAGAGGPVLALAEGMIGIATGAMLGSAFDIASSQEDSDGYTGAIIGGLTLGTAATIYQYFVPIGRREGLLAAGAATAGLMASLTLANSRDLSDQDSSMLAFGATQAGVAAVLLLTAGGGDVSAGDAGLIGATSLYSFIIVGLVEYIHAKQTQQHYNYVPLLLAPAVGMALGGLIAIPAEMSSTGVFELTAYPLGTGLLALLLGSRLADNVLVAKAMLGTIAGTFAIVGMVNLLSGAPVEAPQASASAESFEAMPVPVVMTAGRNHDSLAAGPGLFVRF
ncbi:MAG: hypothetical protein JXB05_20145 [Myxococcaceae bacterium]|nr:hypothetical protein [Myxococcaceae bacterium]